ncbi:MAG: hypothetical protein JOZ81_06725 [Chloroflexi bacterium]|nr:hypothetical protein [Chloroflexota bacterium]MBV9544992.1 hypothetical protein [Chloroflexota bacterium]
MAATPADTQREIARLRGDADAALDEIQRRLRGGLRSVAGAEARITSSRTREDLVNRARENPPVLAVAGVVATGAIAYGAYAVVSGLRERNRPQNRLRRQAVGVRGRVSERVENTRKQLEQMRERGILVKLDKADSGYMRLTDARLELPNKKRGASTVIKKLVWAGLLSVFMALGSVVARRAADTVWKSMVREDPPTEKSKAS